MTDVRIRRAEESDPERLTRVSHSAYEANRRLGFPAKAGSAPEADVSEWIRDDRGYVATIEGDAIEGDAIEGDAIEGEIIGGVRLEETAPHRVKLSRLGVHERWKGQGIGSRLLAYAEAAARDCGYGTVWLTTPGEHPFLPDLYRDRGYEKAGTHPLEYRDYDEIVMEKRLE